MPGSILVVDDEQNLRHTLAFILKRAGYFVTTAESAQDAFNALESGTFDLMILDLRMPEVDGLSLLKMIREGHPRMPVLILTAYGSLESAIDALRLDARDYLLKPIDPAQLLDRIQNILMEEHNHHRRDQILSQMHNLITELGELDQDGQEVTSPRSLSRPIDTSRYLKRGIFYVDLKARYLEIEGRSIAMPPSTFAYLITLLRHSPDPVSYLDLVNESQGQSLPDAEARSLARWQVHQMRQALEPDPSHPRLILTVRNFGYRLLTGHEPEDHSSLS